MESHHVEAAAGLPYVTAKRRLRLALARCVAQLVYKKTRQWRQRLVNTNLNREEPPS